MKKRKGKIIKKRKWKNYSKKTKFGIIFIAIILILLLIFLFLIILNLFIREEINLNQEQIENLNKIFPKSHINQVEYYKGGTFSFFSSVAVCKSAYFSKRHAKELEESPSSDRTLVTRASRALVHETVHTYQGKEEEKDKGYLSCALSSLFSILDPKSSLYNQFKSYIKFGSRSKAYYYPLNMSLNLFKSNGHYNPEQEASIIEDYFYLKFLDGNLSKLYCSNYINNDFQKCNFSSKDQAISQLGNLTSEILARY